MRVGPLGQHLAEHQFVDALLWTAGAIKLPYLNPQTLDPGLLPRGQSD